MQRTRWQILGVLKRHGGTSLEELAHELALSPMTVRAHLRVLESEDLVTSEEVRRGVGRPHFVFRLTDSADELFPKQYASLADQVLQVVKALEPEDLVGLDAQGKVQMVLTRAAQAARPVDRELAAKPLESRVQQVTLILDGEGMLADWQRTSTGYELRECNCPYPNVAQKHPEVCQTEMDLLRGLLGADVRRGAWRTSGDDHCSYLITGEDQESSLPLGAGCPRSG
jgi:predicted ArsR family transcriptional regulator